MKGSLSLKQVAAMAGAVAVVILVSIYFKDLRKAVAVPGLRSSGSSGSA